MLFSITCSLIFSLRLYLTLDEIKEILSPSLVLGSLFSFCRLALVRILPRLSRVTRIRPKCKTFMAFPLAKDRVTCFVSAFCMGCLTTPCGQISSLDRGFESSARLAATSRQPQEQSRWP